MEKQQVLQVATNFRFEGDIQQVYRFGDGHINDTYKVDCQTERGPVSYILQRINDGIFIEVEKLMQNIERVTDFMRAAVAEQGSQTEILTIIKTKSGQNLYIDSEKNYWRAYAYVEDAIAHSFAQNTDMLYQAGLAFGEFIHLLADYRADQLHETIKNFHHTPTRYRNLMEAVDQDSQGRVRSCQAEIEFAKARQEMVSLLTEAMATGQIPVRVTHNDTKINNVLLDAKTNRYRCVIDLDTIMPGSALYDYGDAIRSCGSTLPEDGENLEALKVDFEKIEAYSKGFLEKVGNTLNAKEYELMVSSAILITLECGIRFLEDYLRGDVYYKIHKPAHNLIRAKNQFKFVAEMEKNREQLEALIQSCRR